MIGGRRGITFIEILAALIIFSTVVSTSLVTLRSVREHLDEAAKRQRSEETLEAWLISQETDDPMEEEFTDESGWEWSIVDETAVPSVDISAETIEAVLAAPDLNTAVELLGLHDLDDAIADLTEGADAQSGALLSLDWSILRVEAVASEEEETEELLRWRLVASLSLNDAAGSGMVAGRGGRGLAGAGPEAMQELQGRFEGGAGDRTRATAVQAGVDSAAANRRGSPSIGRRRPPTGQRRVSPIESPTIGPRRRPRKPNEREE